MTKILFILDGDSYLFQEHSDSADQLMKRIQSGAFQLPFNSDPLEVSVINGLVVARLRHRKRLSDYLTSQQTVVLDYLIQGLTVNQIAVEMTLSPETVKYHIENAKIRLQVSTRNELIACFSREKSERLNDVLNEPDKIKLSNQPL